MRKNDIRTPEYHVSNLYRLKAAVVSDVHKNCPDRILSSLCAIHPDVIFMPGDILERAGVSKVPAGHEATPLTIIMREAAAFKRAEG